MDLQKLPVYKLWLSKDTYTAYQQPEDKKKETSRKIMEFQAQVGGRTLLIAHSDWSNEAFDYFGLEEYPNLDALMEYQSCMREMHWTVYIQTRSYLGWPIDPNGKAFTLDFSTRVQKPGTSPIYKVALFRAKPAYYEEIEKFEAINQQIQEAAQKDGVENLLSVYARMGNEKWAAFLLERYPSLDAFYQQYNLMESLGWYKYIEAETILGQGLGGVLTGMSLM